MAKSSIPSDLANALREAQTTIPALAGIAQICVSRFADDASAAMRNGAVLLGVATLKDDKEGEGFRFLLGLPRGTVMTGFLSTFFQGSVGSPA